MLVQKKLGHIASFSHQHHNVDWLDLAWYETSRRILRKKTRSGTEVTWRFLQQDPAWTAGDVLYEDGQTIIAIDIIPSEVIVIEPVSTFEVASACYEIGNKHLPLFFEENELLVPFEQPLFRLLTASGYKVRKDTRKLLQALKTSVAPHGHSNNSLFSKIMQLTNASQ